MIFVAFFQLMPCLCLLVMLPGVTGLSPDREEHREFADSLTNELYANDNECTSSWGVSMLFDLLRPGSSGTTLNQLCDVVGLCAPENNELLWNETVDVLTTGYNGLCKFPEYVECDRYSPLLKVANSIWIDSSSDLLPEYNKVVGNSLMQTDFASQDAGSTVNDWVNSSTLGLIDSIIENGSIPFSLIAINSIYLKAYWENQFNEERTNEDFFYTDASRVEALPKKAHFMHSVRYMPYSDRLLPGNQIIKVSYVEGEFDQYCGLSMVVVLPFDTNACPVSSDEALDALNMLQNSPSRRVALALPKFRIVSKYEDNLKAAMESLGLTAPFNPSQGFCGLLDDSPCLFVDLLIQKTFIEIDENGTIAAAVTAALFDTGSAPQTTPPPPPPVLFQADHPFQLFIYSECEDIVLFEGCVGAPTIADDWPTVQFQAIHSDADFWTTNFNVDKPVKPGTTELPIQPTQPGTTEPPIQPTQPGTIRTDTTSSSKNFGGARFTVLAIVAAFVQML